MLTDVRPARPPAPGGTIPGWAEDDAVSEQVWLAETSPSDKLAVVRQQGERKLRLLACACCRRIWDLIPPACRAGVPTAERFADGLATPEELADAFATAASVRDRVRGPSREYRVMVRHAAEAVAGATAACYGTTGADANPERFAIGGALVAIRWRAHLTATADHKAVRYAAYLREQAAQSKLVEDIFGNPFRPVTVDPRWLTSTAVALARAIYADRAYDRLPILADALEEAGCNNPELLAHLRGDGPHVRGCWAVDLMLGKE
jgi:hypothetical protein